MRPFIISTDSTADLPEQYVAEHNITIHPLYYRIGDVTYGESSFLPPKEFYERMKNGEMPTTMATNLDFIFNAFEEKIKNGYDILHFSFSSALSSSYNNAQFCAKELMQQYPDAKIIVMDTLSASLGQGLLVDYAVRMKENGNLIDDIANWVHNNRRNVCHLFTVDDLFHLQRGGRMSKTTAVIGTIAGIKPILHVDDEGHLTATGKVRGRKKSIIQLVKNMENQIAENMNDRIYISHGDCMEDAQFLAQQIQERFQINDIMINYVSPTIGAHSGPGTIALFFIGKYR